MIIGNKIKYNGKTENPIKKICDLCGKSVRFHIKDSKQYKNILTNSALNTKLYFCTSRCKLAWIYKNSKL